MTKTIAYKTCSAVIHAYAFACVVLYSFGWLQIASLLYASSLCMLAVYWAAKEMP